MKRTNSTIPVPVVLLALALAACQQKEAPVAAEQPAAAPAPATAPAHDAKAAVQLTGNWEAGVKQQLEALIAKHAGKQPAPLAVFDFDNTCIRGDLGRAFFDHMIRRAAFKFDEQVWQAFPAEQRPALRQAWQKLQALTADKRAGSTEAATFRKLMHTAYWSLCRDPDASKCYPWQIRFYAGHTPQQIRELAAQVWREELARPLGSEVIRSGSDDQQPAITGHGIRVVAEMKQLIGVLQKAGFEVWIVTAGPQLVVQAAAADFGLPPERVLGMRSQVAEGKLTSTIDPPPTFRTGKVEAIKKFIGRRPVLAVGDSWTDAEMLGYAEQAVLIDRGYADLKKQAEQSGWLIQPAFPVK